MVSDRQGNTTLYGTGDRKAYRDTHKEQFFESDFKPFIRDASNTVVDEVTNVSDASDC